MKKHLMSIITITILILFCVFKLTSLAVEATISTKSDINTIDWKNVDTIVVEGNAKEPTSSDFILNNNDVYCVEHGRRLDSWTKYNVGTEKTIGNNNKKDGQMIAYILNHGPNNGGNYAKSTGEKWEVPSQNALWYLLKNDLGSDNYFTGGTYEGADITLTGTSKTVYDNAVDWGNLFDDSNNNNDNITAALTWEYTSSGVNVKASGNFTTYKLNIDGTETVGEKESSSALTQRQDYGSGNSISVTLQYVKRYKVKYRLCKQKETAGSTRQQSFIIITGLAIDWGTVSATIPVEANVSMQKYITSVTDINGKNREDISNRKNLFSSSGDMGNGNYNKAPKNGVAGQTPYKYDNPVKIDYGDKVTYTIEVSNNGDYSVSNIVIKDAFPKNGTVLVDMNNAELNKNGMDIESKLIPTSGMQYTIKDSIAAGATKTFTITMKFNSEKFKDSGIVANTAWIESANGITGENLKRDYRTADRDYVQMKQYAVSLEKYVVKVGKNNLISDTNNANYNSSIADRSGHPYYNENGYDKSDDKNKVRVEPGDTITFNIRVRNTGDKNGNYGAIKVKQIGDIPIPPTQLKYDTTYEITGNGGGKLEGNIFKFDSAQLIEPGSYVDIEVRYKLEIPKDDTISSINSIKNTAVIKIITNRNDKEVEDSDGTDNNIDMDYLKTKIYAVSLEKYVVKVGKNNLISDTNNVNYNSSIADRSGHPFYNSNGYDKDDDKNKVRVEPGDTITFNIRVRNTGDKNGNYGAIKVKQIGDIPIPPTQLKYDTTYEITGNGGGKLEGNIFKFDSAQLIEPGSYVDIEVRYKLEISKDDTISSINNIKNTAAIKIITNRNDKEVEDSDGTDNNTDSDYLKTKIYAVGIEKYVTGVGENGLITSTDNINYNCNVNSRENHPQYNKNGYDKSLEANRVRVEPGDYVTFTIKVKNTGTKDGKADYANYGKISTTTISENFTENANCKLVYDSITGATYDKKQITFKKDIVPGGSATFTIKFKVEVTGTLTGTQQNLENTATIGESSISNRNSVPVKDSDGDKNNTDSDYLRTKIYAVDLKKFVSKVEYTGKTNSETLVTKTDDPGYNCANKERENYSGQDKEKDPVRVEPGDLVTFTIRLINTGINADGKADYKNYGAIKVKQITDTIPNYCNYEGNIIGNGGGTVSGDKINFNNAQLINPGAFIDIEVTFKVNVPLEQTGTQQTMVNKAYVSNIIYNRHDEVNDSDNKLNYDYDYIKTKIYAVGIEKYVTGVGTKDNANSLVTDENKTKENKSNYNCAKSDRSGHPQYNKNEYDKSTDDNRVRVEPGDYVTFTIKVKNTGTDYVNYGKISTTTISESFTANANCKLVYDSTSAQKDNESGKIKFSPEGGIEPGKAATFTIKFRVEVTGDLTGTQQNLENTAAISDKDVITNKNTVEVKDSDGDKNNTDSDYLRTKIYKVALEKYVTKVNRYDLSTTAGKDYNVKELTNRKGKPTYDTDKSKANDIVNLETGDTVTFAITVKNIGDDYKNYGTVKTLNITDTSSKELKYKNACTGARYSDGNITGVSAINVGDETTISLDYKVELNENQTKQKIDLYNHAEIVDTSIINKNDISVKDSDGDKNNKDEDYLRTKVYAVSLEKYVSTVVDKSGNDITDKIKMGPKKDDENKPRKGYPEYRKNNDTTKDNELTDENNCNKTKRKNPVTTVTGDSVTYTILLKNDSKAKTGIDTTKDSNNDKNSYNTAIRIGQVIDYLPNGMQYGDNKYTNDEYGVTYTFQTDNKQTLTSDRILLAPGDTLTVTITATVTEDKMSLNILKNVAEINEDSLTNKNGSKVYDTTENNNRDADYIQLNYKHDPNPEDPEPGDDDNIFFAGTVWNDMAPDKNNVNYNKKMDDEENRLSGITVELYREEYVLKPDIDDDQKEKLKKELKKYLIVAKTTTRDRDGNYSFGDNDIVISDQREKYIKGPKISNEDNRWAGYYKYYIVFTYDGITYTSTNNGTYCKDIYIDKPEDKVPFDKDSNASEGNIENFIKTLKEKRVDISNYETRKDFNKRFETINNKTKIKYNTINKNEYIPESQYIYDPEIMSMKSTTNLIDISTFLTSEHSSDEHSSDTYLERSKYIGLGLRGRDIFDLELTSDVSKVEVKVNGVTGTYDYTNKIGVRRGDLVKDYYEDMANKYISKMKEDYVGDLNGDKGQQIRQTDVKDEDTARGTQVTNYDTNQLLQNIFVTYKITVTNASKTEGEATKVINYFDKNYKTDNITVTNGTVDKIDSSNSKYNSILINANSNEIDITYELNNAKDLLKDLGDKKLTTYNMSEIYEYTTTQYGDKDERTYTKGILDKDSAPGSVETEKASLTGKTFSEDTTLDYYFKGENLDKLKYEDDTYATPTLYFTTPGSIRVLRGTVFEDYTVVTDDRVRTGDGIQNSIEPGIEGARVQLIEKTSSGEIIRYETFTNSSGKFKFTNYLPGNYIMKYFYGDNEKTFYIGDTNTKSYNGEDFKSTNNSTLVEGATVNILPIKDTGMQWYSWNEKGVSTATDNAEKRQEVSYNACDLSDDEMIKLNDVRDGIIKQSNEDTTSKEVRNKLWMYANTPDFTLTVEQSVKGKQNDKFTAYEVEQMNFGIAEVPVTTIDLQKHVSSFSIKDSTGQIEIASAKIAYNYTIGIKLNNITDENKRRKVQAVLGSLYTVPTLEDCKKTTEEKNISKNLNKTEMQSIRKALIQYSIPNIVTIIPNWTTKGNVLPGVKATTTVLDVSIEDAKLQGAKLQVTYDVSADIYAEKDFTLDSKALEPSIKYVVDFVDNNLSYAESLTGNDKWQVAQSDALYYGDGDDSDSLKKLDKSNKYTTTVSTKSDNDLLKTKVGTTGTTQITLERILTAQDTTIQDIITSSIDAFEYKNEIRILQLGYNNTIDETKIKNKDRIRTPERYIIVPGKHHDSATSETIAIHPPTGDTSTHTMYYIIGAAGLAVLAIGAFGIKKFVLKGKSTKK